MSVSQSASYGYHASVERIPGILCAVTLYTSIYKTSSLEETADLVDFRILAVVQDGVCWW